jgi:tetratricopeptide (TPR) repeat protein
LEERRRTGDAPAVAETCMKLADAYGARGSLRRALGLHEEALQIFEASGDRAGRLACLKGMANLCYRQGAWNRALELYHQALGLLLEEEQAEIALTHSQIGSVYQAEGAWEEALASFQRSLEIREGLGDSAGVALVINNLGAVFASQERWDEATQAWTRCLSLQEQSGNLAGQAITLGNLGSLFQRQGQWAAALAWYEKSLLAYGSLEDPLGKATILNNLGFVRKQLGHLDEALAAYQEALRLLHGMDDSLRATVTLYNIAAIHEDQGNYREALRLLEQVIELDRRLGHPDLRRDMETFRRIRQKLDTQRDAQKAEKERA